MDKSDDVMLEEGMITSNEDLDAQVIKFEHWQSRHEMFVSTHTSPAKECKFHFYKTCMNNRIFRCKAITWADAKFFTMPLS
jgi:hypothetical protein